MADTSNLSNYLKDVADAIREKKKTTEEIPAANFDTEIRSIETGGIDTSDATATENDLKYNKTAYVNGQKITGTIPELGRLLVQNSSEIELDTHNNLLRFRSPQENIFRRGDTLSATYKHITPVIGLTPEKIVKGNTILGVEGTAEIGGTTTEGVKLFETQEAMQADATAKEGDLAVVYRNEIQAFKEDTQTQFITFPETVKLDTAFTDNVRGRLRAVDPSKMFDGDVTLDQNRFGFDGFSETGMIRIKYMSSDGITYTRSRMEGDTGELTNPVDLGTEIKWKPMELFNPAIGKFMQVGGSTFEGLFTAKNVTDKNKPIMLKGIYYDSGTKYTDQYILSNYDKVLTVLQKITALHTFNTNLFVCYNKTTSQYTVYGTDNSDASGGISLNTYDNYYNICIVNKKSNASCYKYILDIENNTYTEENLTTSSIVHTNPSSGSNWHNFESISEQYILPLSSDASKIHSSIFYYKGKDNTSYYQANFETTYGETLTWQYAPTQLTLEEANQLLPGIIGYGKNGVVIGDESVYDNLNIETMFTKVLGMPKQLDDTRFRVYDIETKTRNIGNFKNHIPDYVKETSNRVNAKYVIGSMIEFYDSKDITNITGEMYKNVSFCRSKASGVFGVVCRKLDDSYILMTINKDFTKVLYTQNLNATSVQVLNSNIAMVLSITESSNVHKYAIFNIDTQQMIIYATSTSAFFIQRIKMMDRYVVSSVDDTTYVIDLTNDTFVTVHSKDTSFSEMYAFEFPDFIYIGIATNDSQTIKRKLYKYTKATRTIVLQETYLDGPYISGSNTLEVIGQTCIETSTYILDYVTGIMFKKMNSTSYQTMIFRAIKVVNGVKLPSDQSIWMGDNTFMVSNKLYRMADDLGIVVSDDNKNTPSYTINVDEIVNAVDTSMALIHQYNVNTNKYDIVSTEFNYTDTYNQKQINNFESCSFASYAKYDIKYYDTDIENADYMLIRTNFVEPNYAFKPYIKLMMNNSNSSSVISQEEYNQALTTANEIKGGNV